MQPEQVTVKDARNNFAELIERAAIGGEVFVVTKFGKPKALIAPVDDLTGENVKRDQKNKVLKETSGIWDSSYNDTDL